MWSIWATHIQIQPSLWKILCRWQNRNDSSWRPCVQDGPGVREILIRRRLFTLICKLFSYDHVHQHNFFLFLAIFFVLCSFVKCRGFFETMKCQWFQIMSSTSMPVASTSLVFLEAVTEESLIQDRLHSTTKSIAPCKILCQARYQSPKSCTRTLHGVLDTLSACKEPQKPFMPSVK